MFDDQSYLHYLNIQILSKNIEIYNIMMLAPKFA